MTISSELDVLALYILGDRKLPDWSGNDMVFVDGGHWDELKTRPEYEARLRRDKVSELWDIVIADLIKHQLGNTFVQGNADKTGMEKIIRRLAAESRFNRRILSKALYGILDASKSRARMVESPGGDVIYVFMCIGIDEDREAIARELHARCHVALAAFRTRLKTLTAIGIATQDLSNRSRFTIAMMAWFPAWSQELQDQADKLQEAGIFKNAKTFHFSELEYPDGSTPPASGSK